MKIEERISIIEDKVNHLSEHLNFICGEMIRKDKEMIIPRPRHDIAYRMVSDIGRWSISSRIR